MSNDGKSEFRVLMATIHVDTKRKTVRGCFPNDKKVSHLCSFVFFELIVFQIS